MLEGSEGREREKGGTRKHSERGRVVAGQTSEGRGYLKEEEGKISWKGGGGGGRGVREREGEGGELGDRGVGGRDNSHGQCNY